MHRLKQDMARQYGPYHKREACRRFVAWVDGAGARVRGTPRVKASSSSVELAEAAAASLPASPGRRTFSPGPPHGKGEVTIPEAEAATVELPAELQAEAEEGDEGEGEGEGEGEEGEEGEDRKEVWPLHLVDLGDAEQVEPLFRLLRLQPQLVHYFLYEHVFPSTMEFQQMKLSASGQELGGDLLFGRRLGFSGTPSTLLPEELGECHFAQVSQSVRQPASQSVSRKLPRVASCTLHTVPPPLLTHHILLLAQGDDAKMLHFLTAPSVVRPQPLPDSWSVDSVPRHAHPHPEP